MAGLGEYVSLVLAATALVAAWRISRGGGGVAIHELSEANRVLEERLHKLGAEVRDLKIENAALHERTDVGAAIEPMLRWGDQHEAQAAERHIATLNVLEMIADRLGADPNGT